MSRSAGELKQQGFTLLELLISLTLFSVISIGLYSGLSLAIKSMAAGEKHAQEVKHVLAIHHFLRNRLSIAKKVKDQENRGKLLFKGEQHAIEFVSEMPLSIAQGGLAFYKIAMQDGKVGPMLTVVLAPHPEEEVSQFSGAFDKPVQLKDIKQLTLSYFGKINGDETEGWHTEWLQQYSLPKLVKIEIVTQSELAWPSFIIAPRAAVSPSKLQGYKP